MEVIVYVRRTKGMGSTEARVEKSLSLIANLHFEYSASINKQATHGTVVDA